MRPDPLHSSGRCQRRGRSQPRLRRSHPQRRTSAADAMEAMSDMSVCRSTRRITDRIASTASRDPPFLRRSHHEQIPSPALAAADRPDYPVSAAARGTKRSVMRTQLGRAPMPDHHRVPEPPSAALDTQIRSRKSPVRSRTMQQALPQPATADPPPAAHQPQQHVSIDRPDTAGEPPVPSPPHIRPSLRRDGIRLCRGRPDPDRLQRISDNTWYSSGTPSAVQQHMVRLFSATTPCIQSRAFDPLSGRSALPPAASRSLVVLNLSIPLESGG